MDIYQYQWVVSTLTGTGAAALFSWLFKFGVERALDRELHRDLERYKGELQVQTQHQVERHKSELQLHAQQQLEQLRSDLNARNDVIRHEIQKQMLRAQLVTTKAHEVYAQLLKLLRIADGAVGGLWGGRFGQSFEKHSRRDIRRLLNEAKTPGLEASEILDLLDENRAKAIELLQMILRRKEERDARAAVQEVKNYILLESLFMTVSVRDLAFKICGALGHAVVAVHVGPMDRGNPKHYEDYTQSCEQASKDLENLEQLMRTELHPAAVHPLHQDREHPSTSSGKL